MKFWLVWNEANGLPTYKHDSEQSARSEAERLAKNRQGEEFHVLELVDSCKVKTVFWRSQQQNDDIPF
jgi:hypothetical protein